MPILEKSSYNPNFIFKNKHFNTIYSSIFRTVNGINYKRKRICTPDDDFLDLDFLTNDNKSLLIVLHGMEGSSSSVFVKGLANSGFLNGYDVISLNFRSCSGEPNNLLTSYHCGKSDDLGFIINYILSNHYYENIFLAGFSLGGNVLLKYLGENSEKISKRIKAATAISVPTNLEASSKYFNIWANKIYLNRFLKALKQKVENKIIKFPSCGISIDEIKNVKNFSEFDNLYTAPVHGFKDAKDYYISCSSENYISRIKLPTLLINAQDDPFLPKECYPYDLAQSSLNFCLETPKYGGHVGFMIRNSVNGIMWHEQRTLQFFEEFKSS